MRIAIVIGSTRPGRRAEAVADWVHEVADRFGGAQFQVLDLARFRLPLLDEPRPAAHGGPYAHPHTRAWSSAVASFDGYVFVTPEYNRSVSGALKNALDFLYEEWHHKAAGFVSYGLAGGVRAVEHLRLVAAELKLADVRSQVALSLFEDFDGDRFTPRPHHATVLETMLDEIITWSRALAGVRHSSEGSDVGRSPEDDGAAAGPADRAPDRAAMEWLRDNARTVSLTDVPDPAVNHLADAIGDAQVVGLGESTRAARETFELRDRLWRSLVLRKGFRVLALQDSAAVVDALDAWARTGEGDPASLLARAWHPWRTTEMAQALAWIRSFNAEHPDDQISLIGVQPTIVRPTEYDTVVELVAAAAPGMADRVARYLRVIRTAHDIDEHVQLHRGTHPGTPFVEQAREVHRLVQQLPDAGARAAALEITRRIVDYHAHSVAGGELDLEREEKAAAATILERHAATGMRIAYWDGLVHTASTGVEEPRTSCGGHLRRHLGRDYVSVAIGFHHGEVLGAAVPPPPHDYVDAVLGEVRRRAFFVDLRRPAPELVRRWLAAPRKVRVINGVYDPDADDTAHVTATSLSGWYDVLVHVRTVTPTTVLRAGHDNGGVRDAR